MSLLHRYSPTLGDAAATAAGTVQWQLEQDFQASRVASGGGGSGGGGGGGYDSEDDEVAADMHMLLWPQEVPYATATAGVTAGFTAATTASHSSWRRQEHQEQQFSNLATVEPHDFEPHDWSTELEATCPAFTQQYWREQ